MQTIKDIAKQVLPGSIVIQLKNIRKLVKKYESSAPVVQIYINDGITDSKIGINNFFSYLSPMEVTDADASLVFYNSDGKQILRHKEFLSHLGSLSISVSELFKKYNVVSPYGAVTLQLVPKKPRKANYKKLGLVASHFFMFYFSKDGALGHIHPLSVLDKKNTASGDFISNQVIVSRGIEKVVLYQVNPTFESCKVDHSLIAATMSSNAVIEQFSNVFAPISVKRIEFILLEGKAIPELLTISVSPLPSANSKPLLMRYYKKGHFSVSHS